MTRRVIGAAIFLLLIAMTFVVTLASPLREWFTIGGLQQWCAAMNAAVQAQWGLWSALYFIGCIAATALSFPIGPVIGIAAGALFGFWPGLLLVWGASSLGSTLAFLWARHLFRDWVEARLGERFRRIEAAFEKRGAVYLLTLRFNPFIPYWIVNLSMGLTHLRLATYVPLTVVGLLPALVIYAHAGTHLAALGSLTDIMSPTLIIALLVLSGFPLFVKLLDRRGPQNAKRPGRRRPGL